MYQAAPVTSEDLLVNVSTSTGFHVVEPSDDESHLQRLDATIEVYQ